MITKMMVPRILKMKINDGIDFFLLQEVTKIYLMSRVSMMIQHGFPTGAIQMATSGVVGFEILLVLQRRREWMWYNSIVDAYCTERKPSGFKHGF